VRGCHLALHKTLAQALHLVLGTKGEIADSGILFSTVRRWVHSFLKNARIWAFFSIQRLLMGIFLPQFGH
jgi:hypothetical protein